MIEIRGKEVHFGTKKINGVYRLLNVNMGYYEA